MASFMLPFKKLVNAAVGVAPARAAAAKSSRKRPAAAAEHVKNKEQEGASEGDMASLKEPAHDVVFKVLQPLNLNLNVQIGSTHTFGDLHERCKGSATKIKRLTQFSNQPAFLEPVVPE
jgi:hypothetical protein